MTSSDGVPWKELAGKWQVDRNENFEEYLSVFGANLFVRQVANASKSVVEISVEGDQITIYLTTSWMPWKQEPYTYIINGPESVVTFNGKNAKVETKWLDSKLVMKISPLDNSKNSYDKSQIITRELRGDELVQTMEVDGVTAVRYYRRI